MELLRSSIKQQVYEIIKEKIMKQEYDLGESINISTLSKELTVSNTPIREALSQLEAEGLVTSSLNTKFKVITLTEKSLLELNQAVEILCYGGLDLCVSINNQDKLIKLLKTAIDNQKQALQKKDYFKFIQDAISFDEAILETTENNTLMHIFSSLSCKLFLAIRYNHQNSTDSRNRSISEHEQILKSIETGDYDYAKKLLVTHYDKHICSYNPEVL